MLGQWRNRDWRDVFGPPVCPGDPSPAYQPRLSGWEKSYGASRTKIAVQRVSWSIVTVPSTQSGSSLIHSVKLQPGAGEAVNVTVLPFGKFCAHVPLIVPASTSWVQSIPAGAEVTVPLPSGSAWRRNVGDSVNSKTGWQVCVRPASTVRFFGLGQLFTGAHPSNLELGAASALSFTFVPAGNDALQVPLGSPKPSVQSMPAGSDVIVPWPVPPWTIWIVPVASCPRVWPSANAISTAAA